MVYGLFPCLPLSLSLSLPVNSVSLVLSFFFFGKRKIQNFKFNFLFSNINEIVLISHIYLSIVLLYYSNCMVVIPNNTV